MIATTSMNPINPTYYTSSQLPPGWDAYQTHQGYWYYFNSATGTTQWQLPSSPSPPNDTEQSQNYQQSNDAYTYNDVFQVHNLIDEDSPYASFMILANFPHLYDEYKRRKREKLEYQVSRTMQETENTAEQFNTTSSTTAANATELTASFTSSFSGSVGNSTPYIVNLGEKENISSMTNNVAFPKNQSTLSSLSTSTSSISQATKPQRVEISNPAAMKLVCTGDTALVYDTDTNKPIIKASTSSNSTITVKDFQSDFSLYSCTASSNSSSLSVICDTQSSTNISTFKRRTFHTSSAVVRLMSNEEGEVSHKLTNLEVKYTSKKLEYSIKAENSTKEIANVSSKIVQDNRETSRLIKFNISETFDPAYIVLLILISDVSFFGDR